MQQAMQVQQKVQCSRLESPFSLAGCASRESPSWMASYFISNFSIIKEEGGCGTQLRLHCFLLLLHITLVLHITSIHCGSSCFLSGKYFIYLNLILVKIIYVVVPVVGQCLFLLLLGGFSSCELLCGFSCCYYVIFLFDKCFLTWLGNFS